MTHPFIRGIHTAIAAAIFAGITLPAQAADNIKTLGAAGRTVQDMQQGIPTAYCPADLSCVIELPQGELVSDLPSLSDAANWSIEMRLRDGPDPQTLFILTPRAQAKPHSSLVILTDQRVYAINLVKSDTQHTPILAFEHRGRADAQMLERINALKARAAAQRQAAAVAAAGSIGCLPPAPVATMAPSGVMPAPAPVVSAVSTQSTPKPSAVGPSAAKRSAAQSPRKSGPAPAQRGIAKGLDYNFSITGQAAFRPTRVYTNGRQTFVDLPKEFSGDLPLVIGQTTPPKGSFTVRMDQARHQIIIDRLLTDFTLRAGRAKIRVTKG